MKKLLTLLLGLSTLAYATNISLLQNYQGPWESTPAYKVSPIVGTNQNSAPMVSYMGNTYVANGSSQPVVGVNPSASSAWDALSVGSLPEGLTSAHIFVGNGSALPADVAMTGAITINNTGVTSATASSFFTLPSTGNVNNVLTGGQTRVVTASAPILTANNSETVTVTYGTAFTTSDYVIVASIVESTVTVPVMVKVLSHTTTGALIRVFNLSSDTAMSGVGTVQVMATGH